MKVRAAKLKPDAPWAMVDVRDVLDELRPEDLYEFSATGSTPEKVIDAVPYLASIGDAWIMYRQTDAFGYRNEPVFVWGVAQTTPGIYTLWGFGTKQTRRAMPQITRWGMQQWLPTLHERLPGIRRIEVRVPASSVHSINWLRKLGMEIECTLPNYSVHGENFFQLAMTFPRVSIDVRCSRVASAQHSSDAAVGFVGPQRERGLSTDSNHTH